jgi:hypothetical protein
MLTLDFNLANVYDSILGYFRLEVIYQRTLNDLEVAQ